MDFLVNPFIHRLRTSFQRRDWKRVAIYTAIIIGILIVIALLLGRFERWANRIIDEQIERRSGVIMELLELARGIVSSELFAPLTILVLIIVAILSFVVIYRGAKQPSSLVAAGASTTVEQLDVRGGQESQSSPYDALQHFIIEPHHFNSLEIH